MKHLLRITVLLIGFIWILAWAAAGRFDDGPAPSDDAPSPAPAGETVAPRERHSAKTLRVQVRGEVQEMDKGLLLVLKWNFMQRIPKPLIIQLFLQTRRVVS